MATIFLAAAQVNDKVISGLLVQIEKENALLRDINEAYDLLRKLSVGDDGAMQELADRSQAARAEIARLRDAVDALQKHCKHQNAVDVSRHGSPEYECYDCGRVY